MSRVAAIAAAASTGAAMAAPVSGTGITLSLLLWASAGAFAGLAKSGPDLWKSIVPPEWMAKWHPLVLDAVRVLCLLVTLGINTLIGLAATWLLNRYLVHSEAADLWPFAVLVCFAIQRLVPPILDALSEVAPAWIRAFGRSKQP